eukprot:scaffold8828_cov46-Cylindrotheca_fusiformis.AAC.2
MYTLGEISEYLVFALGIAAPYFCDLLDVDYDGSTGVFGWQLPGEHDKCVQISPSSKFDDASFECAQHGTVIACVFGTFMMICALLQQYLYPLPKSQLWMDILALGTQVCLGLVYALWHSKLCSEYRCSRGENFFYVFIAEALWGLAWIFTRFMRPGKRARQNEIQEAHAVQMDTDELEP